MHMFARLYFNESPSDYFPVLVHMIARVDIVKSKLMSGRNIVKNGQSLFPPFNDIPHLLACFQIDGRRRNAVRRVQDNRTVECNNSHGLHLLQAPLLPNSGICKILCRFALQDGTEVFRNPDRHVPVSLNGQCRGVGRDDNILELIERIVG